LICVAKSIFAGAIDPECDGSLRCTLASIGWAVLDVVLPQALRQQTVVNASAKIATRMDAYYSSQSGNGNRVQSAREMPTKVAAI
jgi:hypothetical protein